PGNRNRRRPPGSRLRMISRRHSLPDTLPAPLDVRQPPGDARQAKGYGELVALLEELGRRLDAGVVPAAELRDWERRAIANLREWEIDRLMLLPDNAGFDSR